MSSTEITTLTFLYASVFSIVFVFVSNKFINENPIGAALLGLLAGVPAVWFLTLLLGVIA